MRRSSPMRTWLRVARHSVKSYCRRGVVLGPLCPLISASPGTRTKQAAWTARCTQATTRRTTRVRPRRCWTHRHGAATIPPQIMKARTYSRSCAALISVDRKRSQGGAGSAQGTGPQRGRRADEASSVCAVSLVALCCAAFESEARSILTGRTTWRHVRSTPI